MREHLIFIITIVIILILSLTLIIHHAYFYRKIIKDARKSSKKFYKI
jgi:uncharacterized protein YpmB